ncbi:MAG: tRNA (pseudouridine(54)-N(1))-methyltransferase TrmY [Methanomassiliicoccaceae archaeon]|jgi:tRNA (pseudouridine54-N1)-methyltransferase|nr:tRNA (pseudouridine(54)-N(1))-methyltransferase TrmY [Methanomassiliicoccaceae archaeon]
MMRFVITGHRAYASGDFKLDDIAGGAGRLDILVRCVNSAFFLSHSIRKDVELFLVLQGGPDAPKTVRFSGEELRYLNPDERSTASLIRNALLKKVNDGEVRSSPGVYVSKRSFYDVIEHLKGTSSFVYLKEDGTDIREFGLPEDPVFILGDDKDLTNDEEAAVMSCDPLKVCIGPVSLHADHCMIVVLNEIDRRRGPA